MREQQPRPHLTRIFAAVPNMQAIRVISESGAAGGSRPARPRGETATVCVFVCATSASVIIIIIIIIIITNCARHGPSRAEDHAWARACGRGSGEATLIRVTDAVAERLP